MSMLPINIANQRFGMLTARSYFDSGAQGARWECVCQCGRTCIRHGKELLRRNGHTASGHPMNCGCSQGGIDRVVALR
jgi:hypothetical protein